MDKMNQAWEYILLAVQSHSGLGITTNLSFQSIDSLANANYVSFDKINGSLIIIYELLAKENKAQTLKKQDLICELALKFLDRHKNDLADESDKLRILYLNSEWVLSTYP